MLLTNKECDRLAEDTGCSEHNDCLTCPLPNCIYDIKVGVTYLKTAKKQANIRQMHITTSINDIAKQLGISRRTVQRALKEQ